MKNNLIAPVLVLCTVLVTPVLMAQSTIELQQQDGTVLSIPLDTTQPVRINPGTGSLDATASSEFSCSGDCQISLDPAVGGFFIVDGETSTTVPETGGVTFDWRARGAWQCRGTGLPGTTWAAPGKNPWGPFSVSVSPLDPGTYQAALECSNGAGNTVVSNPVEIVVQETDLQIPLECQGRQPANATPTALCERTARPLGFVESTNCFDYSSVFGAEFPGITGQGVAIGQSRDTYFAMEFNTGSTTAIRGNWTFESPQISPTTTGSKLMTISQCPGDFDQTAIENEMGPNCYLHTGSSFLNSVGWKLPGGTGARCELDPGKTYYLNMIYTTDPAGTPPSELQWGCQDSSTTSGCGNNMTPSATN